MLSRTGLHHSYGVPIVATLIFGAFGADPCPDEFPFFLPEDTLEGTTGLCWTNPFGSGDSGSALPCDSWCMMPWRASENLEQGAGNLLLSCPGNICGGAMCPTAQRDAAAQAKQKADNICSTETAPAAAAGAKSDADNHCDTVTAPNAAADAKQRADSICNTETAPLAASQAKGEADSICNTITAPNAANDAKNTAEGICASETAPKAAADAKASAENICATITVPNAENIAAANAAVEATETCIDSSQCCIEGQGSCPSSVKHCGVGHKFELRTSTYKSSSSGVCLECPRLT